eukprot:CFRG2640T1
MADAMDVKIEPVILEDRISENIQETVELVANQDEREEGSYTVAIDLACPPPPPPSSDIVRPVSRSVSDYRMEVPVKRKSVASTILGPLTERLVKKGSNATTLTGHSQSPSYVQKSLGKSSQGLGWWVGLFAYFFAFSIFLPMTIVALVSNDGLKPVVVEELAPAIMHDLAQSHNKTAEELYTSFTETVASVYIGAAVVNLNQTSLDRIITIQLGNIGPLLSSFDSTLQKGARQLIMQLEEQNITLEAGPSILASDIRLTLALPENGAITPGDFIVLVESGIAQATIISAEADLPRTVKITNTGYSVGVAMQSAYDLTPEEIYALSSRAYLHTLQGKGLDTIFKVCLAGTIITLVVVLLFVFIIARYWNEPEIRSRHRNFLLQFFFGTILCPIFLALQLASAFGKITTDYHTTNIMYNVTGFIVASLAILGPISAVILRQRFMYGVFHLKQMRTNYFNTLPWHVFLNMWIIGVFTYCAIEPHNCPVWKRYVPIFVTVICYALEFMFYTWHVRGASGMFVDIWQSARLLLVWIITFLGGYIWTAVLNDSILSLVVICYQLCFLITGGVADLFLLPVIKIFFRRCGYNVLDDVDLEGRAKHIFDLKRVDMVMIDPEYSFLLLEFATQRHCRENVAFLMEMERLKEKAAVADMKEAQLEEMFSEIEYIGLTYIYERAPQEVNLSSRTRKNIIAKLRSDFSVANNPAADAAAIFCAAEKEIRDMIRSNLLGDFQKSPDVIKVMERRLRAVENLTILQNHGLIVSTTLAETDSQKS